MQLITTKGFIRTKSLALLFMALAASLQSFAVKTNPPGVSPTIGSLNLPTVSSVSAPFTLTNPTSKSACNVSYTISNTDFAEKELKMFFLGISYQQFIHLSN